MPGYVIHLAVGTEYAKANDIDNMEQFYKGIIFPDLLDKKSSHYYDSEGNPNFSEFFKQNDLKDDFSYGCFLHLVTDYLFYNKFLPPEDFSDELYHDYNKLNRSLIDKYNVNVPKEVEEIVKHEEGETRILKFDSICRFIEVVSKMNIVSIKTSLECNKSYENLLEREAEK